MAYEWFISYRRKSGGENQARQVAEILSKYVEEDKVFYDRVSMREGNWRDQINDALNSAEHFVLLVNEASAAEDQSNNIGGYRYEIEYALNSEKLKNNRITIIAYDNESYKAVTKEFSKLGNAQKVTYYGEYAKNFEERLCDHFGFVYQKPFSVTKFNNWAKFVGLESRPSKLWEIIQKSTFTNLTGVGGYGKTSLANLLVFEEDHFSNVAYFRIKDDVKKNVYDQFISDEAIDKQFKQELKNISNIDKKYLKIMWYLSQLTRDNKISLFILDIDDCENYNDTPLRCFVEDMVHDASTSNQNSTRLYPKDWKTLIISRLPYEHNNIAQYNITTYKDNNNCQLNDEEILYLSNIFAKIKSINEKLYNYYYTNNEPNDKLKELFKNLFYSPQLISILVDKITANTNNVYELLRMSERKVKSIFQKFVDSLSESKVKKIFRKIGGFVGFQQKTNDKYLEVYLRNLIRFKNIKSDDKCLLRLFMVWPESVSKDVIVDLTPLSPSSAWKEVIDSLVSGGLLVKNKEYKSYMFHSLLSYSLRKQTLYHWYFRWRLVRKLFLYPHYSKYINKCKVFISEPNIDKHKSHISCIARSIGYHICDTKEFEYIPQIKTYLDVEKHKSILKGKNNKKKAAICSKLGKLYNENLKDYSGTNAFAYYEELIKLSESMHIKDERYFNVCYNAAVIRYKFLCNNDAQFFFEKIINCKNEHLANLAADANFYMGFIKIHEFYHLRYEEQKVTMFFTNAKKYFDKVDITKLDADKKWHIDYCNYPVLFREDVNYDKPIDKYFKIFNDFYDHFQEIYKQINDTYLQEDFANVCCRLGDYYFNSDSKKSINYYEQAIDCFGRLIDMYIFDEDISNYSMNNYANSLYRHSCLKKIKKCDAYIKADEIWSKMPRASEDKIKGFVKTSYGIYYPELELKMVKVNDFYIGKEPVSSKSWNPVMNPNQKTVEIRKKIVASNSVDDFCKMLNGRIPLPNKFQIPTESQLQSASSIFDIYDISSENAEWCQAKNNRGTVSLKPSNGANSNFHERVIGNITMIDRDFTNKFPFRLALSV